jgi:sialic acid synthase SpsE
MCHPHMLQAVKETLKPVLVSTGAHTEGEIIYTVEALKDVPVTFLYCEASYPARYVDFRRLHLLMRLVENYVGFSDHTLDVYNAPLMAQLHGAVVLEKHFNPLDFTDTPDAPHSLGLEDFSRMVQAIRDEDQPRLFPTPGEKDMVYKYNRTVTELGIFRTK